MPDGNGFGVRPWLSHPRHGMACRLNGRSKFALSEVKFRLLSFGWVFGTRPFMRFGVSFWCRYWARRYGHNGMIPIHFSRGENGVGACENDHLETACHIPKTTCWLATLTGFVTLIDVRWQINDNSRVRRRFHEVDWAREQ